MAEPPVVERIGAQEVVANVPVTGALAPMPKLLGSPSRKSASPAPDVPPLERCTDQLKLKNPPALRCQE